MNRIYISRPKLITKTDYDSYIFDGFEKLDFKYFLFRCKRLNAGVPDDSELFVRAVYHGVIQGCGRLGHIDFRCFKYLFASIACSGYIQNHPVFRGSAVRNAVPCGAGDFCF